KDIGPEEKSAGGGEREIETLEQPQRHQRLHDKTARERVEAEKRGKLVDHAARRAERTPLPGLLFCMCRRQPDIEHAAQKAEGGIQIEHRLQGADFAEPGAAQKIRKAGSQ